MRKRKLTKNQTDLERIERKIDDLRDEVRRATHPTFIPYVPPYPQPQIPATNVPFPQITWGGQGGTITVAGSDQPNGSTFLRVSPEQMADDIRSGRASFTVSSATC